MTLSGVGSNSSMQQSWQATMQQRKQDFSQLGAALQSGDLAGARKAFSDLQSVTSGGQGQKSATSSTTGSSSGKNSTLSDDFSSLSQALQSGNVTDAQTAFAKLQTDMQAQKKGGHHHHGGAGSSSSSSSSSSGGQGTGASAVLPDNSTISISV